jgi:hypothetical protein
LVRVLLALNALHDAGTAIGNPKFKEEGIRGVQYILSTLKENQDIGLHLPQQTEGPTAIPHLILALSKEDCMSSFEDPKFQLALKKTISFLRRDGSISHLKNGRQTGADHDFLPGAVLLGLTRYAHLINDKSALKFTEAHFEWYRRRFRLMHPWAMVWWQVQAWASLFYLFGNRSYAEFVFEMADWSLEHQVSNGSFLVVYAKNGPSFLTGCVLEGIADAWLLAKELGDKNREERYRNSWLKGISFMDQLIIDKTDTYFMREPADAIGGVRESCTGSYLRIDYTAHLLMALIKGSKNF